MGEVMSWHDIAEAIYWEAFFTECCIHDWLCWEGGTVANFDIAKYFDARPSFADRNVTY